MTDTLIKVESVSKKFCRSLKRSLWYGLQDLGNELRGARHGGNGKLRPEEFWAVKDVGFELKRGECLGLIGRNGAGKTTLLRMLNGLIKPDQGRIELRGRVGALIALGAGFNPILTGRENIYVNASVLGLTKRQIDQKFAEIIEFAEVAEFIDAPVQTYSSGMQVRLGFSIASAVEPDVLLLDEVLAVGDVAFRVKCYQRIGRLLKNAAVILVSHDMAQIPRLCNRILYAERGRATHFSSVEEGINAYLTMHTSLHGSTSGEPEFLVSSIRSARISVIPSEAITFDKVTVKVALEACRRFNVGLVVGNFVTADGREAAEFRVIPGSGRMEIAEGTTQLDVEIRAIPFSSGLYVVNLAIFDETKKATLIHFVNACHLTIVGSHISNFPNVLDVSYVSATTQPI